MRFIDIESGEILSLADLEKELKSIMSRYESEYIRNSFHVVKAA